MIRKEISIEYRNGEGGIYELSYNAQGLPLQIQDPNLNITNHQYDQYGNLTSISQANGSSFQYTYDLVGNTTSITDSLGNLTSYEFDDLNRITRIVQPDGTYLLKAYDPVGNLLYETDESNNTINYVYNVRGRLVSFSDQENHTTSYQYDILGRVTSFQDANGNLYQYEYDALDQVTKVISPDGGEMTYIYNKQSQSKMSDAEGLRPALVTDAMGNTNNFDYNEMYALKESRDAFGNKLIYSFSELDKIVKVTDKNNNDLFIEYNYLLKPKSMINGLGDQMTIDYDVMGNIIAISNFDGTKSSYSYDKNYRLTKTITPLGNEIHRSYDLNGNLDEISDLRGVTTKFTYDSKNQNIQTLSRSFTELEKAPVETDVASISSLTLDIAPTETPVALSLAIPANLDLTKLYRLRVSNIHDISGWDDASAFSVHSSQTIRIKDPAVIDVEPSIAITNYDTVIEVGGIQSITLQLDNLNFDTHYLYIELLNGDVALSQTTVQNSIESVLNLQMSLSSEIGPQSNCHLKVTYLDRKGGWASDMTESFVSNSDINIQASNGPQIQLDNVNNSMTVTHYQFLVKGQSFSPNGMDSVLVNGNLATTGNNFSAWEFQINLTLGVNYIDITATDTLGNTTRRSVILNYIENGILEGPITGNPIIHLTLNFPGAVAMILSDEPNFENVFWEQYQPSKIWVLTGDPGYKSVFVKYQDGLGIISEPFELLIYFDPASSAEAVKILNGSLLTSHVVIVELTAPGATHYRLSEDPAFTDAVWLPMQTTVEFEVSEGSGRKVIFGVNLYMMVQVAAVGTEKNFSIQAEEEVLLTVRHPLQCNKKTSFYQNRRHLL